tara:strand:+ start:197 stop:1054 length:858 start_codon:yes stop_codon:yes gene_type:complete
MTKSIDTLVEDIYALFTNDEEITIEKKHLDAFAEAVVASVASAISEVRKEREPNLRLSLVGQKDRKIWYEMTGAKKEPLAAPTLIKFLYGHILEELLILFTKVAGHEIKEEQAELYVNGVKGHKDATVDGVLIDFKSASSFSFKKFRDGDILTDDPFGYIAQLSSYSEADKNPNAGFVVIDKSSGELCYCPIDEMDMINPVSRIDDIREFLKSETPPDKCYSAVADGASGNFKLAFGCVFCDFKYTCWQDSNDGKGLRTFMYSNGPKHLVEVGKTPNVPEVTNAT